jgi:hypothetical protein
LIAIAVVVVIISYVSLVIGELVLDSGHQVRERIAILTARPLNFTSRVTHAVVVLLTASTSGV